MTMTDPRDEVSGGDPIHLFVPTFRVDEVLAEIRVCLERGWTGLGFKTVEFERAWCAHTGLSHAHFLNSATAGLHLAFRLLRERHGWRDGDEVVTTPLTFVSTNHAILYERLQPVFADVDESLCLDPDSVLERVGSRTRAVCFVGLGGNPGRWQEVRDLCRERGLLTVLDASHMSGTWVDGRHAGWDADVAVFSFQAVKNLPTADSGMVCFADAELDSESRKLSWLGISKDTYTRTLGRDPYRWRYEVDHIGFKYHGSSVMAAMGLVGLRHLEEDNAKRREIASWYDDLLSRELAIERIAIAPGVVPSRHLYQVLVDHRDEVLLAMNAQGIYPGVHYRDNTTYRVYAPIHGLCPRARAASERLLSLPLHLRLERSAVEFVASTLCASVHT